MSSNYSLWETQILSLNESWDLLGFITGGTPTHVSELDRDHQHMALWTCTDRLAS